MTSDEHVDCSFSDYLTLHSNLILLPADDESCEGAILSMDYVVPDVVPEEPSNNPSNSGPNPKTNTIYSGSILLKLADKDGKETQAKELPFDKILAMARDAKYPIKLTFGPGEEADEEDTSNSNSNSNSNNNNDLGRRASELGNAFGSTFSRWGRTLSTQRRASAAFKHPSLSGPTGGAASTAPATPPKANPSSSKSSPSSDPPDS
eukprot:CAMPEP_0182458574 /NCGR_PEP_ID=MMETSP1319-20130603/3887_1 /TAXON_ID=172717 /ORGANISM="Bolidomonas pacifica, Strain RCC208" /LENGTH=205 /DNA_ID=CAMNT_0024657283 /DNA_START=235 /DNA_END=848 /DNA_ORIENTATION=-